MKSSRTKNSIKNVAFNFGYQVLVLILGFVNRTIFINILGVNYLGISGIFYQCFH